MNVLQCMHAGRQLPAAHAAEATLHHRQEHLQTKESLSHDEESSSSPSPFSPENGCTEKVS